MCKRKYTHLKIWEAEIVEMKKAGRTKREIADHFGLTKEQVKDLLKWSDTIKPYTQGDIMKPRKGVVDGTEIHGRI